MEKWHLKHCIKGNIRSGLLIRKPRLNVGCLRGDRVTSFIKRRNTPTSISRNLIEVRSWLIDIVFYRSLVLLLALVRIQRLSYEYGINEVRRIIPMQDLNGLRALASYRTNTLSYRPCKDLTATPRTWQ
ncbi:hypothetical protein TNCV_4873981 [Trichonephila clavipes]|nr:hypothetical protein TNCV_4873981 [Trichonephila clavipes]